MYYSLWLASCTVFLLLRTFLFVPSVLSLYIADSCLTTLSYSRVATRQDLSAWRLVASLQLSSVDLLLVMYHSDGVHSSTPTECVKMCGTLMPHQCAVCVLSVFGRRCSAVHVAAWVNPGETPELISWPAPEVVNNPRGRKAITFLAHRYTPNNQHGSLSRIGARPLNPLRQACPAVHRV